MATQYTFRNTSKVETAANTMTYENVEIPDTTLAKRVWVVRVELDCSLPNYVAASTTETAAHVSCGKSAPTAVGLAQDGVITSKHKTICSTGAAGFAVLCEGPDQAQGHFEVFKHPDGKYYVTLAIKGTNNTAQASMAVRIDFEIEM